MAGEFGTADLIGDLTAIADSILGIRDDLGAAIHKVFIVTKTWPSGEVGLGEPEIVKVPFLPSPGLKNLSHDLLALEGGNYQRGDLILTNCSKQSYPKEEDVSLEQDDPAVEKFYEIYEKLYQVISVVEKYITWDVQVRKVSPRGQGG